MLQKTREIARYNERYELEQGNTRMEDMAISWI
jgi:hypothetical protein